MSLSNTEGEPVTYSAALKRLDRENSALRSAYESLQEEKARLIKENYRLEAERSEWEQLAQSATEAVINPPLFIVSADYTKEYLDDLWANANEGAA